MKAVFVSRVWQALGAAGLGSPSVRRPQLSNKRHHGRRKGGAGRFDNSDAGENSNTFLRYIRIPRERLQEPIHRTIGASIMGCTMK